MTDATYRKDPSFVARKVVGEILLVPVRQRAGELTSIFNLNEPASLAWSLLDGRHSLTEIRDNIVAEYEIEPEVAWRDLLELIEQLSDLGMVVRI